MLDELEQLCETLSTRYLSENRAPIAFGYGTKAELNVLADGMASGFLLFHVGYFKVQPKELASGAIVPTYSLTLWVFCRSALSDKPEDKRANLRLLEPTLWDVLLAINKLGTASNVLGEMYQLNMTDCNLDGIQLTLSLSPPKQIYRC